MPIMNTSFIKQLGEPVPTQSHADLLMARAQPGADQVKLAPMEHRAFAREYVKDNPVTGTIGLAAGIPAYAALKFLGIQGSRTPTSLNQIGQGYAGILDGLKLLSQ